MPWKKSSPAVEARFAAALPDDSLLTRRPMFGYAGSYINGWFFAGLFEDDVVIRMPPPLREQLAELARAKPFNPMGKGKGMTDWWVVPSTVARNQAALGEFLARACVLLKTLPPKPAKGVKGAKGAKVSKVAKASEDSKDSKPSTRASVQARRAPATRSPRR